jgi:hypothetical protein
MTAELPVDTGQTIGGEVALGVNGDQDRLEGADHDDIVAAAAATCGTGNLPFGKTQVGRQGSRATAQRSQPKRCCPAGTGDTSIRGKNGFDRAGNLRTEQLSALLSP